MAAGNKWGKNISLQVKAYRTFGMIFRSGFAKLKYEGDDQDQVCKQPRISVTSADEKSSTQGIRKQTLV